MEGAWGVGRHFGKGFIEALEHFQRFCLRLKVILLLKGHFCLFCFFLSKYKEAILGGRFGHLGKVLVLGFWGSFGGFGVALGEEAGSWDASETAKQDQKPRHRRPGVAFRVIFGILGPCKKHFLG